MRISFQIYLLSMVLLAGACQKETAPAPDPAPPPGAVSQQIQVLEDEIEGLPIVVAGSQGRNFAVAFRRELNGDLLRFTPLQNSLPILMEDQYGNQWNLFGEALFGPDRGAQLNYVNSGMGYWFIFGAMYPGLEIYGEGPREVTVSLPSPSPDWDIPTQVVAQGTGFDAIQALDNPAFVPFRELAGDPEQGAFLEDEDLVVVISLNGESKVYPHAILDWHEVVNDVVGGVPLTLTYCPLTGTAKVWERKEAATERYGVSGLLYNSNVLPFDRATESLWHQLEGRAVYGGRRGEQLRLLPFLETTWRTWRFFDTQPTVLSTRTGVNRDYSVYPYGDYRSSELVAYPLSFDDDRLPRKERVFSVIVNGRAKVYPLAAFR